MVIILITNYNINYGIDQSYIYLRWGVGHMTPEQRSFIMSRNKARDTKPERILRKALWHLGLRYRKNYRKLHGTPDIVLTRQKIVIFVDGDFWHAHGHQTHPGEQIQSNRKYWIKHLGRNVERDKEINDYLTENGWLVLRFWESEIEHDLIGCVNTILKYAG